jgi:hypothetical protein
MTAEEGQYLKRLDGNQRFALTSSPRTVGGFNPFTGFDLMFQIAVLVKE